MFDRAITAIQEVYTPLSPACIESIREAAQLITWERNRQLVREGQYSDQLYFLISGAVKAYYLKDGRKVTEWFAFENDFICALACFYYQKPSEHYIETLEETSLLSFSRMEVQRLCDQFHDFERLGHLVLEFVNTRICNQ